MTVKTNLVPHEYRYFPYERKLAILEAIRATGTKAFQDNEGVLTFQGKAHANHKALENLVYFKSYDIGEGPRFTKQKEYESLNGGVKRQSTRYATHGLHDYKGKFNPQLVRGLLNAYTDSAQGTILDPFCGSGTSLVESAISGRKAIGFDMNPLAVFIANSKLLGLKTPIKSLVNIWENIRIETLSADSKEITVERNEEDQIYLEKWFKPSQLKEADKLASIVTHNAKSVAPYFLCILSNLLRDYSEQEPADLRIRRRRTDYPKESLTSAFLRNVDKEVQKLVEFRKVHTGKVNSAKAYLQNSGAKLTAPSAQSGLKDVSAIITSPPYATALPYIDTNRLSLVWLKLIPAREIRELEAKITGSRDFRGKDRDRWSTAFANNSDELPDEIWEFCMFLENSLIPEDGFRKRSVPTLLYRYFYFMKNMFERMAALTKTGVPFILVVGVNSTNIGGKKTIIDTPDLLIPIANSVGWSTDAVLDMETYRRFEIHKRNSVSKEKILVFRRA